MYLPVVMNRVPCLLEQVNFSPSVTIKNIFTIPDTVSYTHLDVYKRQHVQRMNDGHVLKRIMKCRPEGKGERGRTRLRFSIKFTLSPPN